MIGTKWDIWSSPTHPPKYTRGILQAIGVRQFHEYLIYRASNTSSETGLNELKQAGIIGMKTATRQYARSQMSWIQRKLLPLCIEDHGIYGAYYKISSTFKLYLIYIIR